MKIKQIVTICLLWSLSATTLSAAKWYMGFMGGYDYNAYSIETNYAYDMRYKGRGGLTIGMPMELCITQWFALRVDVMYVQKNHKMYRTNAYSDIYTNTGNHYLHLPVMLNFSFGGEKLRGYMSFGGYAGCWLASRREGQTIAISNASGSEESIYAFDEIRKIDNAIDRRIDSGVTGNVGIAVNIDERMMFHIEAGCYYSLLSTERDKTLVAPNPRYDTTFTLQCGLTFAVGKHKQKRR
ncbi:MAG: outer membrane beta-barrel protein [Paludibacteraceae bacterium]|nr:PorT family protein [Bacteroidales bacterium]MDD6782827.1 outer membrane beta-barrel protein [Bacteroidales bacterium]